MVPDRVSTFLVAAGLPAWLVALIVLLGLLITAAVSIVRHITRMNPETARVLTEYLAQRRKRHPPP